MKMNPKNQARSASPMLEARLEPGRPVDCALTRGAAVVVDVLGVVAVIRLSPP